MTVTTRLQLGTCNAAGRKSTFVLPKMEASPMFANQCRGYRIGGVSELSYT